MKKVSLITEMWYLKLLVQNPRLDKAHLVICESDNGYVGTFSSLPGYTNEFYVRKYKKYEVLYIFNTKMWSTSVSQQESFSIEEIINKIINYIDEEYSYKENPTGKNVYAGVDEYKAKLEESAKNSLYGFSNRDRQVIVDCMSELRDWFIKYNQTIHIEGDLVYFYSACGGEYTGSFPLFLGEELDAIAMDTFVKSLEKYLNTKSK